MPKQIPKISEVIWKAANEFLPSNRSSYSCWSILDAVHSYGLCENKERELIRRIFQGLDNMGIRTISSYQFDEVPRRLVQQYRYSWLMFAYEIALEQGV